MSETKRQRGRMLRERRRKAQVRLELDRRSMTIDDVQGHKAEMIRKYEPWRSKVISVVLNVAICLWLLSLVALILFMAMLFAICVSFMREETLIVYSRFVFFPALPTFLITSVIAQVLMMGSLSVAQWKRYAAWERSSPPHLQQLVRWVHTHFPKDDLYFDELEVDEVVIGRYLVLVRETGQGMVEHYIAQW